MSAFTAEDRFASESPIRDHVRPKRAINLGKSPPTLDSLGSTPTSVEAEYKENIWPDGL
jgi:hypothetical protein